MEQKGQQTERGDWNRAIAEYNHVVIDLATVRAERDLLQQEVEAARNQVRRQHGWTEKEIAVQQQVTRQHATLKTAFTQALQALTVDPFVLALAKVPDPAAAFAAQWREADGRTLRQLKAQAHSSDDYAGIGQHGEQQLERAQKDLAQVDTFWGRILHADRLRAARRQEADIAQHLADNRHKASAHHADVQHYQEAVQTAAADWQAWQPRVEQTRTALSEARALGTITALTAMEQERQRYASWAMEWDASRQALMADARTISARILSQRIADWHTPDVLTRFMEQISPTLQALHAEQQAPPEHETATERLRRRRSLTKPKHQEQELEP
jgi:hypothetical protein